MRCKLRDSSQKTGESKTLFKEKYLHVLPNGVVVRKHFRDKYSNKILGLQCKE